MAADNLITFNGVTKDFNTDEGVNHVLRGVNLSIPNGQIYGIIGYSGAGKSTLIRCINGIETPNSGKVNFADKTVNQLSKSELLNLRSQISMIFQQFNLMPERTIADNVALPIKYQHISKTERINKVKKLLKLVGLEDKYSAYPSSLSGGQKQRVAIARALINEPKVLLCDEATSALDPDTTESILNLLKRLNHNYGITIVIVTHEMQVIEKICDQIAVLDKGSIIEAGNVYDVFSNPQQSLTKKFVRNSTNINLSKNLIHNLHLSANQQLLHLNYRSGDTIKPLISYLSREFSVNVNIITGDMKIIQDKLLGNLVVVLDGDHDAVQKAQKYLNDQKEIEVEVVQNDK